MNFEAATNPEERTVAEPGRRLLVVAFHYPPDNTSTGVLRTHCFTLYLEQHGWASEIISVNERMYKSVNNDPPAPPTHAKVHRTWAADAKELFGIGGRYPAFLGVPDRYWPWIIPGYRQARRVIAKRPVDAIFTTYPPVSALLIGLLLKRSTGLPWIVDLRDPWVEESMSPLRRRFESGLEKRVLTEADAVICNTPAMKRWFLARYPHLPESKFRIITNGYDESDFHSIEPAPIDKFEILYPGVVTSGNRNPAPLLDGLKRALDRGWLPRDTTQLTFLGTGPYGASNAFRQQISDNGLEDITDIQVDRIPYRKALRRMAGADVLVVLSQPPGDNPEAKAEWQWAQLQVPAKVYEYLRLGRPLLALVSEGAVAELLERVGGGAPISPKDPERIAAFLRDAYVAANEDRPEKAATVSPIMQEYNRERLTAELADLLDHVSIPGSTAVRDQ